MSIHSMSPVMQIDIVVIDGVDHEQETEVGQIVIATPNSGGATYARLQFNSGESYKWFGDVADVDDNVETDPELEPRWEQE